MIHQIDQYYIKAEQAARTASITSWTRCITDLNYRAAVEARKAKRAARAGLVVQLINGALLFALIYLRICG